MSCELSLVHSDKMGAGVISVLSHNVTDANRISRILEMPQALSVREVFLSIWGAYEAL